MVMMGPTGREQWVRGDRCRCSGSRQTCKEVSSSGSTWAHSLTMGTCCGPWGCLPIGAYSWVGPAIQIIRCGEASTNVINSSFLAFFFYILFYCFQSSEIFLGFYCSLYPWILQILIPSLSFMSQNFLTLYFFFFKNKKKKEKKRKCKKRNSLDVTVSIFNH